MKLPKKKFSFIVQYTPLISIDLLIENTEGKILLGKRVNEPAQGLWFVPGGRVYKDETLDMAFSRIVRDEVGIILQREDAIFCGVYEHFYENNVFDDTFTTHYIVLAHKLNISEVHLNEQHEEYRWFDKQELLSSSKVHRYTKDYFQGENR
jgi:colanic acid biosynthesis protein WcaH